jgi:hypothetical protein
MYMKMKNLMAKQMFAIVAELFQPGRVAKRSARIPG